MLTAEEVKTLEEGDVIDMGGVFLGITPEPINWTVYKVTTGKVHNVHLEARYFGVLLTKVVASIYKPEKGGAPKVLWKELEQ
jgi:hypothetical protein